MRHPIPPPLSRDANFLLSVISLQAAITDPRASSATASEALLKYGLAWLINLGVSPAPDDI
jgi:hypothetical protein